jgi:hypothetical protein
LAGAAIWLAGCDNLSRTLGLVHDAPDEFTVTTRAPLAMPPDFNLPTPSPGVSRPQEVSERAQAEQALVPQVVLNTTPAGLSPGQDALVQAAGPPPPPDIRKEVDAAALKEQNAGRGLLAKLQFWRTPPPPGIVVDPTKEAQRLRENSALGQSQETGDTPIVQPKQRSWFEGLF